MKLHLTFHETMLLRNLVNKSVNNQQAWRGIVTSVANGAKKPPSPLAELRKRTGYGLSLCKKALASCNDDVTKAQEWLNERAQAEGWNKANKLEGRTTSHGLIGVQVDGNKGVILELNCETDFVAKNSKFLSLLHEVTALNLKAINVNTEEDLSVVKLDKQAMDQMESSQDGKTLADLIALKIGLIGENISNHKAEHFVSTNPKVHLIGYTHPPGGLQQGPLFYGKYGVLMALENRTNSDSFNGQSLESIGRQLCQHVVGMNPTSVGHLDKPDSWPSPKSEAGRETDDESVSEEDFIGTTETDMIHQPFLLDTDRFVRDILLEVGLNIKGFVRYEVGQNHG